MKIGNVFAEQIGQQIRQDVSTGKQFMEVLFINSILCFYFTTFNWNAYFIWRQTQRIVITELKKKHVFIFKTSV